MSECAVTESPAEVNFGPQGLEIDNQSCLETQDQTTSTWLYNQREVQILTLKNQIETAENPGNFIYEIFRLQCAQLESETPEKIATSLETLRSHSLPEIKVLIQKETNPKLRDIFDSYIKTHELNRSNLDEKMSKEIFSQLSAHKRGVEVSQLHELIVAEQNPHKKVFLLKQQLIREIEKLNPDFRDQAIDYFKETSIKPKDLPSPVRTLIATYRVLYKSTKELYDLDLLQFLEAIYHGHEAPKPRQHFLELYNFEKQMGFPLLGPRLLQCELEYCSIMLSFVNMLDSMELTGPSLIAALKSHFSTASLRYLKESIKHLNTIREQLDINQTRFLSKMISSIEESSYYFDPSYKIYILLILSLYATGNLSNKEALSQLSEVFKTQKNANTAFQFTQISCAAPKEIALTNPAAGVRFLEQLKDFVDLNIYSSWYSFGNQWNVARAKALLEIAKVYHVLNWRKPEKLLQEINKLVESLEWDRFDIQDAYGYSSTKEEWFYYK